MSDEFGSGEEKSHHIRLFIVLLVLGGIGYGGYTLLGMMQGAMEVVVMDSYLRDEIDVLMADSRALQFELALMEDEDEALEEIGDEQILWDYVALNTVEGVDSYDPEQHGFSQLTSVECTNLIGLVPSSESFWGIDEVDWGSPEFLAVLDGNVPVAQRELFDKALAELSGYTLQFLCQDSGSIYLTALSKGDIWINRVLQWSPSDDSFTAYPSIQPDGEPVLSLSKSPIDEALVVVTGYGDAGWISWQWHYLDSAVRTADLIESCVIGPSEYMDEGSSEHELTKVCQREFIQ